MAKIREYNIGDVESVCDLGKALSSPVRIQILHLLDEENMIIGEIARALHIPASSTAFHLKILEQAGLVRMEEQPGSRGLTKLCTRKLDSLTLDLRNRHREIAQVYSVEMPVGAFSNCKVSPTCGMFNQDGAIGSEDKEHCFYYPERISAGIVYSSSGYLEYRMANGVPGYANVERLVLSLEMCSEAPGYNEDWKSDITFWINGKECGTWTCPGDFGARRGRLTPPCVDNGSTQYGMEVNVTVEETGTSINGVFVSDVTIHDLEIMKRPYVKVKFGNKPDAKYVGGFNVFGKNFGDYNQDIILTMEYR